MGRGSYISTAIEADEINYTVTGGSFNLVDATIMFLEAKTYTVVQTVTNVDGTDESTVEVVVSAPINTYKMDFYSDNDLLIVGDVYWFASTSLQLRIDGEGATAQETNNLVKVTPDMGIDPFHGTGTRSYTYHVDGGPGTYTGSYTNYPATGTAWDAAWFTTSAGTGFDVTLVYEGATEADNVYDLTLMNTTLDGYYDAGFNPVAATGIMSLTYRGKITPAE